MNIFANFSKCKEATGTGLSGSAGTGQSAAFAFAGWDGRWLWTLAPYLQKNGVCRKRSFVVSCLHLLQQKADYSSQPRANCCRVRCSMLEGKEEVLRNRTGCSRLCTEKGRRGRPTWQTLTSPSNFPNLPIPSKSFPLSSLPCSANVAKNTFAIPKQQPVFLHCWRAPGWFWLYFFIIF